MTSESNEHAWELSQIAEFSSRRDLYALFAETLRTVLGHAAKKLAPEAIIQARAKAIPSFAEKIERKRTELDDPVNELTDLCGGRVITLTQGEVRAMCDFIESHFDIDWENSVDVTERHRPSEFGYRSLHYIVSFRPGVFPTRDVPVEIPEALLPGADTGSRLPNARAEIQVRTLLEHAWAAISHDRLYKAGFAVPAVIEREFATTAALLESADRSFTGAIERLSDFRSSHGVYQSPEDLRQEIDLLSFVQTQSPDDLGLALRIAALASALGEWDEAAQVLEPHAACERPEPKVLTSLGVALCMQYASATVGDEYKRGRSLIEQAVALDPGDATALEALATTWDYVDDERARDLHRRAYEQDSDDPYALTAFLTSHIALERTLDVCAPMSPAIRAAIGRADEHVAVGINLPEALYAGGLLRLLVGEPYEALAAYARAVAVATSADSLTGALRMLDRLKNVGARIEGFEWVRRLLLLGLTARFPDAAHQAAVAELATPKMNALREPVAILSGGTSAESQTVVEAHRALVLEGFEGFVGTLLGGGTREGVSGLAGQVRAQSGPAVRLIGYLPRLISSDATVDPGSFDELRRSEGADFSPLEPLQNWVDILVSGVDPAAVKVIGINGGSIAAAEFRIALALGASVALIEGSGRATAQLMADPLWTGTAGMLSMPADPATLRAFLRPGEPIMAPDVRELVARRIHEVHSVERRRQITSDDPALAPWDALDETLKDSNRAQADDMAFKLAAIGCAIVPAGAPGDAITEFTPDEIETLAEIEHGRWNAERLLSGWRWGANKDVAARRSPYIVSWDRLADDVREWDRNAVRAIPGRLSEVGLAVQRTGLPDA